MEGHIMGGNRGIGTPNTALFFGFFHEFIAFALLQLSPIHTQSRMPTASNMTNSAHYTLCTSIVFGFAQPTLKPSP